MPGAAAVVQLVRGGHASPSIDKIFIVYINMVKFSILDEEDGKFTVKNMETGNTYSTSDESMQIIFILVQMFITWTVICIKRKKFMLLI